MIRVAAIIVAGIALAFGIVHAQGVKKAEGPKAPLALGKIRLTPVDLFPGDLKRLQPHLEISGACYKVEYNGPQMPARLVLEEWKNGVREGYTSGGLGLNGPSVGEVSVSIKPSHDDEGHRGARHDLDRPDPFGARCRGKSGGDLAVDPFFWGAKDGTVRKFEKGRAEAGHS